MSAVTEPIIGYMPLLLEGALITLKLSSVSLLIGTPLGFIIGLIRSSGIRYVRWLTTSYIELFRSVPILLQLFFIYYAIPIVFGLDLPAYPAAIVAFSLYSSAYIAEVFRTGLLGVPRGQWEAAASLAFRSRHAFVYIVLPQAMRISLPPLVNVYIGVIKDSSLASVIGFVELTSTGLALRESSFGRNTFGVLLTVAVMYFVIAYSLSLIAQWIDTRVRI